MSTRAWHRSVVLLLALAAACTGVGGGGTLQPESKIAMRDDFFVRDVTRIPAGIPVTFANEGRNNHNAVAVDGSWKTSEVVDPGVEEAVEISEPGVYRFFCIYHGTPGGEGMAATLVVGDVPFNPRS